MLCRFVGFAEEAIRQKVWPHKDPVTCLKLLSAATGLVDLNFPKLAEHLGFHGGYTKNTVKTLTHKSADSATRCS